MSSFFEHKAFKWIAIGISAFLIFSVIGGFALKNYFQMRKREAEIAQKKEDEWNYQEKFRLAMYRIRQNLKLEHYLAAYKNLDTVPTPDRKNQQMVDEYLEVLNRIGHGLIANNLLKESEEVFQTMHDYSSHLEQANEALGQIESKRSLESARLHYAQGVKLHEQKRYRDSAGELQKADVELNSVANLKFDDVTEDKKKVAEAYREARYQVNLEEADHHLKEAERVLKLKDFKKVTNAMSQASQSIGKAAFVHSDSSEVLALRKRLFEIDAEMGYLVPNSAPIHNAFPKEMIGKTPRYFFMHDYSFSPTPDKDNLLTVGMKFQRDIKEPYYIVRYRIYFHNGRDVFNGFFLMPGEAKVNAEGFETVLYKQEIPEDLKGVAVRQMELKVFDSNDVMISHVTRAFRRRDG